MCISHGRAWQWRMECLRVVPLLCGQRPPGAAAHSPLIRAAPDVSGDIINMQAPMQARGCALSRCLLSSVLRNINKPQQAHVHSDATYHQSLDWSFPIDWLPPAFALQCRLYLRLPSISVHLPLHRTFSLDVNMATLSYQSIKLTNSSTPRSEDCDSSEFSDFMQLMFKISRDSSCSPDRSSKLF